jgi:hypothetical protein
MDTLPSINNCFNHVFPGEISCGSRYLPLLDSISKEPEMEEWLRLIHLLPIMGDEIDLGPAEHGEIGVIRYRGNSFDTVEKDRSPLGAFCACMKQL